MRFISTWVLRYAPETVLLFSGEPRCLIHNLNGSFRIPYLLCNLTRILSIRQELDNADLANVVHYWLVHIEEKSENLLSITNIRE
jgi:hypothetical protein